MPERAMPFGKFKGYAISECPVKYLDWLIGQEWMKNEKHNGLLLAIEEYLQSCPEWQRL